MSSATICYNIGKHNSEVGIGTPFLNKALRLRCAY